MSEAATRAPVVPIPAADPLFVDILRTAVRAYTLGDYARAASYFQDAAACAGYRPEAAAWANLGAALEYQCSSGALVSRDVSLSVVLSDGQ